MLFVSEAVARKFAKAFVFVPREAKKLLIGPETNGREFEDAGGNSAASRGMGESADETFVEIMKYPTLVDTAWGRLDIKIFNPASAASSA